MNEKLTEIFSYETAQSRGLRVDDDCNLDVVLDMRSFDGVQEPAIGCTGEAGYRRGFVPLSDILKLAIREFPELVAQSIQEEQASETFQTLLCEPAPEADEQQVSRYA